MIAARQIFLGRGAKIPTAADYVQTGLVAMWDGIENAGFGEHSESSDSWKNLGTLGSSYDAVSLNGTFSDNGAVIDRTNSASVFKIPNYLMRDRMKGDFSVEIVFTPYSAWFSNFSGVFGGHGHGKRGLVFGQYEFGSIMFSFFEPSANIHGFQSSDFVVNAPVAVSVTAESAGGIATIYKNANLVDRKTGMTTLLTYAKASTLIGAAGANSDDTVGSDRVFSGIIHSVRIYGRPINSSEIAANNAVDKARFNLPTAS